MLQWQNQSSYWLVLVHYSEHGLNRRLLPGIWMVDQIIYNFNVGLNRGPIIQWWSELQTKKTWLLNKSPFNNQTTFDHLNNRLSSQLHGEDLNTKCPNTRFIWIPNKLFYVFQMNITAYRSFDLTSLEHFTYKLICI